MAVAAIIVALLVGGIGLIVLSFASTLGPVSPAAGPAPGAAVTITETRTAFQTSTVTATETKTMERTVTTTGPGGGLTGTVKIGTLLCLGAALTSYAENEKVAMDLAAREANDYLKAAGAGFRIELVHEDTQCSPPVAEEKIKSLFARGITLIIGPMTSGEVRQIKGYADTNKILLISQSSTAPDLKIPNDFVYRFVPADDIQGPIGPRLAKSLGVTHFMYVWRGDAWGDGLHTVSTGEAKKLGLELALEIRYAPDKTEFSAEVSQVAAKVESLINAGVSPDKIMLEVVGFDEILPFLAAAADYPVLEKIRWFGSDGTALTATIFQDPKSAGYAQKVRWINPLYISVTQERRAKIDNEVKRVLGRIPDSYSYAAYSAVWAYALALLSTQRVDADAIRQVIPTIAPEFLGIKLDAGGDMPFSDYLLWVIQGNEWVNVGRYLYASASFEWYGGFTP